ncbi:DUF3604 domain-containing protein [Pseudomonadota bacterium]
MRTFSRSFNVKILSLISFTLCVTSLAAQDFGGTPAPEVFTKPSYSPWADRNFPDNVYWGDTHLHTTLSFDAGAFGNRLGPEDAYQFARGEEVTSTGGYKVRLSRPLDFLVVADHSDNMGLFTRIFESAPEIMSDPEGRRIHDMIKAGGQQAVAASVELIDAFSRGKSISDALAVDPGSPAFTATWDRIVQAAEDYNDPGRFTAFIGYEWTSLVNTGDNLHRVVIYRDDGSIALRNEPYTTMAPYGSPDPMDLWKWMKNYENQSGGNILAIAHNGNLSNGIMFPVERQYTGRRLDKQYISERILREPLYEVTQIKGDGETHPFLSPNDEFADYETWAKGNLNLSVAKTDDMLQYEYAREALKNGLALEDEFGENPYKFGMIGSTDSHTSLATAEEDNFFGKHSGSEPSEMRMEHAMAKMGDAEYEGWSVSASGLTAVWAKDNTRKALFDAMERKEVYATTGPRMLVRFWGGWEFEAADAQNRLPGEVGYRKGVPMGGDLRKAPASTAPSFLVAALKDPLSGNLDRIQIVKGWLDKKGKTHEKVYDVAWGDAGSRQPDANGKLPPVGNTVDIASATWTNTIGDPELITVWTDPDFDPAQRAFYYARVLEIPTPRWTAYEAKFFAVEAPENAPMITQERAYTSPIWYTP